jgi:heat shock protein HslJ
MRSARHAVTIAAAASVLVGALALSGCAAVSGLGAPPASGGPTSSGTPSSGPPTSGPPSTPSAPGQSIAGGWVLISGQDGSKAITPSGATVTLTINGADSGGSGGCNAFGAVASGSTTGPFTIRVGIHTDMACVGDERNVTEHEYFDALGSISTAALSGGELTLSGPGASLKFRRSDS